MKLRLDNKKLPALWVRPLRIWGLVAVLSISLVATATQYALNRSRDAWLNQGREKVAGLASSYRSQVEDTLRQLDQIAWFVGYLHAQRASSHLLNNVFASMPSHASANSLFIDAGGIVRGATDPVAIGGSVRGLSFFVNHLASNSTTLVINPPEPGIRR